MAVTTYIVDKDGNQIDASTATVPSDRHFRGAWSLSGSVISEDMTKAKEIFKDKIREVRGPLLAAEDVAYMKALEADDSSAKTASVNAKTALRNAPAASAITNASDIAALKAAWDTSVLGDSTLRIRITSMALTTVRPQGMGFVTGRKNLIINGPCKLPSRAQVRLTDQTVKGNPCLIDGVQISTMVLAEQYPFSQSTDAPSGFAKVVKSSMLNYRH